MSSEFVCRYCGKEKAWDDRNYDIGLRLAEMDSLAALGHAEEVCPYLICNQCADELIAESEDATQCEPTAQ
ncbi:Hypothetical protein DPCES_5396 [Desulfitobacterium hafniense]|uniref:Uncharacterized protein n=1 Tax=Desulfitobacterium hafniense TaxID=49338 RepID=A0A098AUA4_DESHA|nr:hypothetical protein [Desulfitobacterium hafniense]CDV96394.1 Hypothetical protein DPCES_5396 [Desulfitobacterium hafniense]